MIWISLIGYFVSYSFLTNQLANVSLPVIIWTSATVGRPRDGLHVYAPESEVWALVTNNYQVNRDKMNWKPGFLYLNQIIIAEKQ